MRYPPEPGKAVLLLAVVAAIVTIQPQMTDRQRLVWLMVVFILFGVEYRAIDRDRDVHDKEQADARAKEAQNFRGIGDGIKQAIQESQRQFDATMKGMEGILGTNTEILGRANRTLDQTMGGNGYPILVPTFPSNNPLPDALWPVKIIHQPKDRLPLIDVNLDISLEPEKDSKGVEGFTPGVIETIFHPVHYNLGTILPGIFEAPFRLQSGRRYYIYITTRRSVFYEKINIDSAPGTSTGWKVSLCIHGYNTKPNPTGGITAYDTLLYGKCE